MTVAVDPSVSPAQQWVHTYGSTTISAPGPAKVQYTVDANCTTSARSINLIITGTNPSSMKTFTVNQQAATAVCTPPPTISSGPGGITNAASFIPGGPIAQGSFFSIFGSNMGPPNPGVKATSYPLQTTLANVSVKVTDMNGNNAVQASARVCGPIPDQCDHAVQRTDRESPDHSDL
jgi:hypothetical protein